MGKKKRCRYAVMMIQTKNLKQSMKKQQANDNHITVDMFLANDKEVQILQKLQHSNIFQCLLQPRLLPYCLPVDC